MTNREVVDAIIRRIDRLTLADIKEYIETNDKFIWVVHNILDLATTKGLSLNWEEKAEIILDKKLKSLGFNV